MSSNASQRETLKLPWSLLRAGGRHGLSDNETRDPIGLAVLALNKLASSDLIDRLGIRKASEQTVYRVTSAGLPHRRQRRSHLRPGRQGHPRQPGARREEHRALRPDARRGRADARRRGRRVRRGDGPPGRRRRQRGLRRSRRPAQGLARDRSADPRGARGARRHRHRALRRRRHAGPRGAGQGRHGPGRRAAGARRRRHRAVAVGHRRAAVDLPARVHRRRGPRRRARPRRADRAVRPDHSGDHAPRPRATASCSTA